MKLVFFIEESNGTMSTMELRPIEQAKVSCAKKLFERMPDCDVKNHDMYGFEIPINVPNGYKMIYLVQRLLS